MRYEEALNLYTSALTKLGRLPLSEENRNLTIEALQSSAYVLCDLERFDEAREVMLFPYSIFVSEP